MNSKGAVSFESVSSCGTNNSAYFCLEEDSTAMKYSISDDTEGFNTQNRSNEESMMPGMKVEVKEKILNRYGYDSSHPTFPFNQCQRTFSSRRDHQYNYNMPSNANSIFRPHLSPNVNSESNKISHANPVLGSDSDGTNTSNHKSDVGSVNVDNKKEQVGTRGDATMNSSCSRNRTSKMIHDGPNSKDKDNEILSTPNTKDKLHPVKLFRMTSRGNSDLTHIVSSSNHHDTQKECKYNSFSLNNHSIDGTLYTNVKDTDKDTDSVEISQDEKEMMQRIQTDFISLSNISKNVSSESDKTDAFDTNAHNSETPKYEVKSTYLGYMINNMKIQKERMIEQFKIFQSNIYSYSSSLSSCCTTNVVSSVIPTDRACSEGNVVEKEPNETKISEYIVIDELRGFEQWTKDIGIEIAEIYKLLKHHYFEYPISCFDRFDSFQTKDRPVSSQLQRIQSSSMGDNLTSQNFVNEVDAYAQELGITRSEFLARVASIISHQKNSKDICHNQTKNDDINNTLMKLRASHVPCIFSTNTRVVNSNESLNLIKNLKMTKDDLTGEWNNGLEQSYRSSPGVRFTSCKDSNNSKVVKANTRIGMGKVHIGSSKKRKTAKNIIRKGRFRLIT